MTHHPRFTITDAVLTNWLGAPVPARRIRCVCGEDYTASRNEALDRWKRAHAVEADREMRAEVAARPKRTGTRRTA